MLKSSHKKKDNSKITKIDPLPSGAPWATFYTAK